ncbi:MAG: GTPase ObgE [Candidatus Margulisbacteria bacterium]|nr:GTPase ObgE [Candidatus Margulisiibacteriota bacterium]
MAFVDTLTITISSGNGGNGCSSFRREKFVAKGGPDGGDGGSGGGVVFIASKKISTFLDLSKKRFYKAQHGEDGKPKKQTGKSGSDCIIHVPCGTCMYNKDSGELIAELNADGHHFVAAKGGKGGKGNVHFSTSRIQTPRRASSGSPGTRIELNLELKLIADVGLIGYPNAGKSTLLQTLTRATPKIANYPFTTLHPNLGIFRRYNSEIVIADIPGIIEGASSGIGLGNEFLRHISRTNVLLFLVEPVIECIETTIETYSTLIKEINAYDASILKTKKRLVAINKVDLLTTAQINTLTLLFKGMHAIQISCFLNKGIEELEQRIYSIIHETDHH